MLRAVNGHAAACVAVLASNGRAGGGTGCSARRFRLECASRQEDLRPALSGPCQVQAQFLCSVSRSARVLDDGTVDTSFPISIFPTWLLFPSLPELLSFLYNTPPRTCQTPPPLLPPSPALPLTIPAKRRPPNETTLPIFCSSFTRAEDTSALFNHTSQNPAFVPQPLTIAVMSSHPSLTSTYRARASLPTTGPLASYLLSLISVKQTNLCLSADVETSAELLQLAEDVGDSICLLKTHCDIVTDWSDRTAQALREIAKRKWFLIFEDRKFADIGGMSRWSL